ncbi:MAG TPA: hypothetical protein VL916_09410 [Ilumatobacteraceae bacterium]|nr:hypothetical protein [Ilumatobacteraceae bacterium]
MKLLLVESTPGNAAVIARELADNGHELVSCTDEHGGPCRGLIDPHACPLESHVDLAIVTRSPDSPRTLAEMGSICARRHRVPTVEVDPDAPADDLPDLTVTVAVKTRRVEAAFAQSVRQSMPEVPALVDVHRQPSRIVATVHVPERYDTPTGLSMVADRARHAIREHDPFVPTIDVNVVTYPDAPRVRQGAI